MPTTAGSGDTIALDTHGYVELVVYISMPEAAR
jgi:hypothetical protein